MKNKVKLNMIILEIFLFLCLFPASKALGEYNRLADSFSSGLVSSLGLFLLVGIFLISIEVLSWLIRVGKKAAETISKQNNKNEQTMYYQPSKPADTLIDPVTGIEYINRGVPLVREIQREQNLGNSNNAPKSGFLQKNEETRVILEKKDTYIDPVTGIEYINRGMPMVRGIQREQNLEDSNNAPENGFLQKNEETRVILEKKDVDNPSKK
ncbi:MAG: hypothetical protein LBE27_02385 [Deltaproteobacteria bacterium]|jgi:hypothetical protein|nr:hypothetical protein [Deltaproteobacteria bacterium]